MPKDFWPDLAAWWATVPPEFAFLLAVPFAVAALGLAARGSDDPDERAPDP